MSFFWSQMQCKIFLLDLVFIPSHSPLKHFFSLSLLSVTLKFKVVWLVILYKSPQLGFVWCFLVILLRLCTFSGNTKELILCPSQCTVSEGTGCWYLITDVVNFDHVVWLVSVRFLHHKVKTFLTIINNWTMGSYFDTERPVSHHTFTY